MKQGSTVKGKIGKVNFTAFRATNLAEAQRVFLYDRIADFNKPLPPHEKLPLFKVELERYCKVATLSTVENLETVFGVPVEVPTYTAPDESHHKAVSDFLQVDSEIVDKIVSTIDDANGFDAPREILPPEELTKEELSDPSSSGAV